MSLEVVSDVNVLNTIDAYPERATQKLSRIRELIFSLCAELEDVESLHETFKWSEPSYITNIGSTIRMAWKESAPDNYFLYFNCNTKLIDTFRELYSDTFCFEGNRAIIFKLDEDIPEEALKHCLAMALSYHKLKKLPLLGA